MITLTESEQALVATVNAADKLNTFLYKNEDSHALLKKQYEGSDRFNFVDIQNKIKREMTPDFHTRFHGRECMVQDPRNGKVSKGIIRHELTRTFEGRTSQNSVYFINYHDGEGEVPTLWVDIYEDNRASHVYPLKNITLCD